MTVGASARSFGGARCSRTARGKIDVDKLVNDGKVDPEFAYFQRNGLVWAYYDTQNRGSYDRILFSSRSGSGKVDRAFRVDKSGVVTLDATLDGRPLVNPALFGNKRFADKMRKLAGEMFADAMVER